MEHCHKFKLFDILLYKCLNSLEIQTFIPELLEIQIIIAYKRAEAGDKKGANVVQGCYTKIGERVCLSTNFYNKTNQKFKQEPKGS